MKRGVYEGVHHVPFVVRWPNKIKPGTKSNAIINHIDILKTLLSSLTGSQLRKGKRDQFVSRNCEVNAIRIE